MYICLCNPFTDKDVQRYLGCCKGKAGVAETYKACSGGESPNCCTCMETLRGMVRDHNNAVAVKTLGDNLPVKNPREKA